MSGDLSKMAPASAVARTLQIALEKWPEAAPRLEEFFGAGNTGAADGLRDYDPEALESALPRTYQFVDGSAYLNHVELFRKARGAKLTPKLREQPLMYQAVSDGFLRPTGAIPVADAETGVACLAERRIVQKLNEGRQKTSFMQFGDRATIEMFDANDQSVFGAIDQEVIPA